MSRRLDVYPPGDWGARPAPTAAEIEKALVTAGDWWWYGAFGRGDDSIRSYLDLFERSLSGEVRRRAVATTGQYSLAAHTEGCRNTKNSGQGGVSCTPKGGDQ